MVEDDESYRSDAISNVTSLSHNSFFSPLYENFRAMRLG